MEGEIKLHFFDKILAKTFLRLIPRKIRPNYITVARFLMTPAVIYFFWSRHYLIGSIFFLLAAFTDALDGAMARTRNQITDWGKIFDPMADKLLIGAAVYTLVLKYIDVYAAWLIIILEAVIIIAAVVRKKMGVNSIEANIWAKIKMNLQVWGVLILLFSIIFNIQSLLPFSNGVFYLAIAFAIISLFTYSI